MENDAFKVNIVYVIPWCKINRKIVTTINVSSRYKKRIMRDADNNNFYMYILIGVKVISSTKLFFFR